ncbi:TetR/AcrR family transcriptional regulator [Janthinobacterium sp. BJB1]|uniref:TetR/AcrR family transcriptional regulator n=1 Tax=unclassified Janthinobacterium TaxID=2610881 RepID=UPI00095606C7|nr:MULTISPECIES: TetR/AcrR family transcriptional regulator [unclassified Janthinobacterium]MBE3023090.1 TetR/AcrR family transcriptional regulator [Janthinobacterium sp. GW458P]PHV16309.1 TetR/AcrR family transcriptional regulator [Janthinobacterium sp. BJB303]PJC95963.1 TetR/AcrR family transcriptional regulator [Janthinobacterium sp. BJB1]SIQ43791.1 transcriptional regulator, TetR family [Janthinobacterium sp. TND4EL3]
MNQVEKKHPDPERANTRRKQVLDAAESCFSRRGFHGASMAEISKAAGMSAGHIYNYFDSKDAIIAAFVMQNTERVSNLMQDLAQRDDPLQAVIDNAGEHVLEALDAKTWMMPLEIFAEASRNPVIAAMLQTSDQRSRQLFLSIIRDARIKRGLPADEEMLQGRLDALVALYQGLPVRFIHNPDVKVEPLIAGFRIILTALLLQE